jgi:hypothetical protein
LILYKLTFSNGKVYIGQTVRMLEVRMAQHGRGARANSLLPVHCAWRKHGEPSVDLLGEYGSMDELHTAEIAAIAEYGCVAPLGYNVSFGGETAPSKNPNVAAKIAAKARGRKASDATREVVRNASISHWQDEAYRAKVHAGVMASWTPEMRAAAGERSRARKGEKRSEEAKANMRGRVFSEEHRARMSTAAKARIREPRTEETCRRLAASVAASWQDPEIRAKRSAAIREGHRRRKEAQGA